MNDFGFALETPLPSSTDEQSVGAVQPSEWLSYTQLLTGGTEEQMCELVRISEIGNGGIMDVSEMIEIKEQMRQQQAIIGKMMQDLES